MALLPLLPLISNDSIKRALSFVIPQQWAQPGNALLSELLWRRFSPPEDVKAFLNSLNSLCAVEQHVVTYGHEPSPEGYQVQHNALFNLSTSFAMRREKKVYLSLS